MGPPGEPGIEVCVINFLYPQHTNKMFKLIFKGFRPISRGSLLGNFVTVLLTLSVGDCIKQDC